MKVQGSDLKVGDTIEVWWSSAQVRAGRPPRQDTITDLRLYEGPLRHLFGNHGAQIAEFQFLATGMTIANGDYYKVIRRSV